MSDEIRNIETRGESFGEGVVSAAAIRSIITLPRHKSVSSCVARFIARNAGWLEESGTGEDMIQYPALMDGEAGVYGVSFPDLPGIVAMGATKDEALLQAERALGNYAVESERAGEDMNPPSAPEQIEIPTGHTLVSVRIPPWRRWRVLVQTNWK